MIMTLVLLQQASSALVLRGTGIIKNSTGLNINRSSCYSSPGFRITEIIDKVSWISWHMPCTSSRNALSACPFPSYPWLQLFSAAKLWSNNQTAKKILQASSTCRGGGVPDIIKNLKVRSDTSSSTTWQVFWMCVDQI